MYYLIEIANGDEKIAGKSIYTYNSERGAMASFHKKLGIAMASDLYTSDVILVIDQVGNTIARERYIAPITSTEEIATE